MKAVANVHSFLIVSRETYKNIFEVFNKKIEVCV